MAYSSTVDERYAGTYIQKKAGSLDASGSIGNGFTLAQYDNAYGALVKSGFAPDLDVYALGSQSIGTISVSASSYTWDFSSTLYGSSSGWWLWTPTVYIYNSAGQQVATGSGSASYKIDYLHTGTFYVGVEGSPFSSSQYSLSYSATTAFNYLPTAVGLTITGGTASGSVLTVVGNFYDSNGLSIANSINGYTYSWYTSVDNTTNWVLVGSGTSYTLKNGDLGKYVDMVISYRDDDGFNELVGPASVFIPGLADTTPPIITYRSDKTSLGVGETATITFTLNEASANFVASDVTVSGGTLSNFTGSGTSYTATFTPAANSTANGVVTVNAGVFTDAAGNANTVPMTLTMSVSTLVDTTPPTIAVSSSKSSLALGDTATLTFTLNEASTNFVASDVTVSGGTLSNFTGSGTTYTATFTPTANSTANGVVSIASGVFTDAAGNASTDGSEANNTVSMSVNTVLSTQSVAGKVQDGYVAGAAIYVDRNGNNRADADEDTGIRTDAQGNFKGSIVGQGSLIAVGGTNIDTGLANTMILMAPSGSTVINPITTLIESLVDTQGIDANSAQQKVLTSFGITGSVNLLSYDPLAQSTGDAQALSLQKLNVQLAIASTLSGDSAQVIKAVATLVNQTSVSGNSVNLANPATLSTIFAGTTVSTSLQNSIAQSNLQTQGSVSIIAVSQVQKNSVQALPSNVDLLAPTLIAAKPLDKSVAVGVGDNLMFEFSEPISKGTGSIILKTYAGFVVAEYVPFSSSNVVVSSNTLTINPSTDLSLGTTYILEFKPNSIFDLAGNGFIGTSTYSFTTTPTAAGKAISGTTVNDTLSGGTGNDTIDGGAGVDTLTYGSAKANYIVTQTGGTVTVNSSSDGLDSLTNVERLKFADTNLALDLGVNQSAGQTSLLIGAVLPGKLALDVSKQGLLGSVIGLFDLGYSTADLSGALLRLDIWSILTGQNIKPAGRTLAENTAIVNYLMTNVNGVAPDAATLKSNADVMHSEAFQGAWLAQLALSNAGQNHIGLVGLASTGIVYA